MNLGEIITMLKLFPADTPIINAPNKPHYQKKKGMAFVMGSTIYDQNAIINLSTFLYKLENLITKEANELHGETINEDTQVYLVEGMHKAGVKVKGLLFTLSGIEFVREEYNYYQ